MPAGKVEEKDLLPLRSCTSVPLASSFILHPPPPPLLLAHTRYLVPILGNSFVGIFRRYCLSSLPRAFTTTWFQPDLPIHSLEPLRIFAWFARWKFLFRSPAQAQHFLSFFFFLFSRHNERFKTCPLPFFLSLVMSQPLLLITLCSFFSLFIRIFFQYIIDL